VTMARSTSKTTLTGDETEKLVLFAQSLSWEAVPREVVHAAKRHLLDTCAAIVGGMGMDVTRRAGRVPGVATHRADGLPVPGSDLRLDAPSFAFLCGTAAHGIELDDGYREGSMHPGAPVVPAILAAAAQEKASGRHLLEALVVGYEAATAIAEAAHPALRNRGFHPTAVVGPLAASLAVGRILKMDDAALQSALGIAASGSAGLFAFLDGGGDVKRLHGGQAARTGLLAAYFAREGISGPSNIISTPSGFAQAFAYGAERHRLAFELPPVAAFRTPRCYIKSYACCRHLQPAIEAVLQLAREHRLTPGDVTAINVETYSIAASHAATGWGDFASAQLSFPYVLAVALHHGTVDLHHFDDTSRADPALAATAARVTITATPEMDALYPKQRPSRVTLATRTARHTLFMPEALGSPEMPLSEARVVAKFQSIVEPVIGRVKSDAAIRCLRTVEIAATIDDLLLALSCN
jgi:2-methylcitrate dehydratase PrpD